MYLFLLNEVFKSYSKYTFKNKIILSTPRSTEDDSYSSSGPLMLTRKQDRESRNQIAYSQSNLPVKLPGQIARSSLPPRKTGSRRGCKHSVCYCLISI